MNERGRHPLPLRKLTLLTKERRCIRIAKIIHKKLSFLHPAILNKGSYVLLVYLLIGPFLIWGVPEVSVNIENRYSYLLSSQAQIIGTLLAIVFSTTVVVVELVTQYSHIVIKNIFGKWTLFYVSPYILGVLMPLLLLNSSFWILGAQISLFIGILCIILLAPFWVALSWFLSIEYHIREIRRKAQEKTRYIEHSNKYEKLEDVLEYTQSILYISIGAADHHDYDLFDLSLDLTEEITNDIMNVIPESKMGNYEEGLKRKLIFLISNIGREKLSDPKIPYRCSRKIRKIGKKSVEMENRMMAEICQKGISKISQHAARKQLVGDLVTRTVRAIGAIGRAGAQLTDYASASRAVENITQIAQTPHLDKVTRYRDIPKVAAREILNVSIYFLRNVEKQSGADNAKKIVINSLSSISSIYKVHYLASIYVESNNKIKNSLLPLIKNKKKIMSEENSRDLRQESIDTMIEMAKGVKRNKSSEEWPDIIQQLLYFTQDAVEAGYSDGANDLLNEAKNLLESSIEDAGPDHPVWDVTGNLGFVVEKYEESESVDVDVAYDLLTSITNKAHEVGAPTDSLVDLMRSHRSFFDEESDAREYSS